jgi:peptidoglycan-associated lipoprotein
MNALGKGVGRTGAGFASLLAIGLIGCGSAPPPRTEADVAPAPVSTPPPPALPKVSQIHIDDAIRAACGITEDQAFFKFDSSTVLPKDVSPLGNVAMCFTQGPLAGRRMKLVGRADPRGEYEYNMVLGQSRADQVASFLEGWGVRAPQIVTTSRGAMDALGHDENTWRYDRRVDVMLSS